MFNTFFQKTKLIIDDVALRNRILFMFAALIVFRILAVIPIPGVNVDRLNQFFSNNQYLGLLNIFSGGGLANLSIVMLGVGPFITSSIILQLMTVISPKMKAMYQEEGEAGRAKFTQWSRYLTVPLAFAQAFAFLTLLHQNGIVSSLGSGQMITNVLIVASGSILLMWIGELITEFGIGNGVSLLIFAGIVARIPTVLSQMVFTFDVSQIPLYIAFFVAAVAVVAGVVFITEAERPIPVTYARQTRGSGKSSGGVSTYLPLRVNQAGVIPIIFALSILLFPRVIAAYFANSSIVILANISNAVISGLSNQWIYGGLYFFMVFFFTYFYTAITFDPKQIADNLQKSGAFVPGVRPGGMTYEYVANIVTRITLVGALFLGIIAVLPVVMQGATGINTLTLGGTALLIAVSVVLDVVKRVEAQISIREY